MSLPPSRALEAPPIRIVAEALAPLGSGRVWIVGGTVRDALLGRTLRDVDLAVVGDPAPVAHAVARRVAGPAFPLSEQFGGWRVVDRAAGWTCDVSPLQGQTIVEDLGRRDFTLNAMAVPLGGGELLDPHGGRSDLAAGVLRVLGEAAYEQDPLRPLRLARLATELAMAPDPETERLTRAAAARVPEAAGERIWAELRRLVVADRVLEGLEVAGRLGLVAAVLPELDALRDVPQSHFHHLDVHSHTVEVLRRLMELERSGWEPFGALAAPLVAVLSEPLADELTRGQALRLAALLHDVGKPPTRRLLPDGRPTFIGHDAVGERMVQVICGRLRTSQRLRTYVASITRHHLALGFLVHKRPLSRRDIYGYLTTCQPVEIEVTAFSCADRLATRGRGAEAAIAAHLELARELMADALAWRAHGPPKPPLRGDELAEALAMERGPELGALLRELEAASYAGEITARDDALALARRLRDAPGG